MHSTIRLAGALVVVGLALTVAAPAQGAATWERAWGKDVGTGGGTGFEICTVAASCQSGPDTPAEADSLWRPWATATDGAGDVYVADGNNQIQKFDSSGNFLRAWGKDVVETGSPDDTGTGFEICVAANGDTCRAGTSGALGGELRSPDGVATDAAGNVYVADADNNRIQKFDSSGNFLRAWGKNVVATGSPDDTGSGAEICVAASGDTCQAGSVGGAGGSVSYPNGVAADGAGNVYVAEDEGPRISKFDSSGSFLRAWGKDVIDPASAGNTGTGFEICVAGVNTCKEGDNTGALGGEIASARGVGTDAAGNVYVGDAENNRVQKFDSSGNFLRAWGKNVVATGSPDDTGNGAEICVAANGDTCQAGVEGGLGGELKEPFGVAPDASGDVYVADRFNNRIQKFDSSGNFLSTWGKDVVFAGPGNTGTGFEVCVSGTDTCQAGSNSTALGGELNLPPGVATDPAGNVYVADASNNRVQKFADPPPPAGPGASPSVIFSAPDTLPPDTSLRASKINQARRKATFRFSSSEPSSTFLCKLDGKAFTACISPKTYRHLKPGSHKFRVEARDAAGNIDPTPLIKKFKIKP
jgi:sugar lactone lactonase YvrE